jgi:MazG family protein
MQLQHPSFDALVKTIAALRAPDGCPWDREQTHASLTECLVEECAELLEAIDRLDYPHMEEELGDVLLNVLMQAEIAKESGHFDIESVCRNINDKLIRRHPHVFGAEEPRLDDSGAVLKRWDEIKAGEKKHAGTPTQTSIFKEQPPVLPSLLYAKKTFKQVEKAGLSGHACLPTVRMEELAMLPDRELAESLFAIAAICRKRGLDPELLCRQYTSDLRRALEASA